MYKYVMLPITCISATYKLQFNVVCLVNAQMLNSYMCHLPPGKNDYLLIEAMDFLWCKTLFWNFLLFSSKYFFVLYLLKKLK